MTFSSRTITFTRSTMYHADYIVRKLFLSEKFKININSDKEMNPTSPTSYEYQIKTHK